MACKASLQGRSRHPLCRGARAVCISITPGLRATAAPGAGRALSPLPLPPWGQPRRSPRAAGTPHRTRLKVLGLGWGRGTASALPFPLGKGRAVFCLSPHPAAPLQSRGGNGRAGRGRGLILHQQLCSPPLPAWIQGEEFAGQREVPKWHTQTHETGRGSVTNRAAASVWDQAGPCAPTCRRRGWREGTEQICSTSETLRDCRGWSQPEPHSVFQGFQV